MPNRARAHDGWTASRPATNLDIPGFLIWGKIQKGSFLSRAVVGLALCALAAACDSPTEPSRNRIESSQNRTEPGQNRLDLTGTYTLTLSASSRCPLELPEAMRTRTYTVTIAQVGGSLMVTLPSIFPPWDNRTFGVDNRFTGVFGENNDVIFQLQFEEWFLEGLVTEFSAYGRMTATISPTGLSGFWDGYMRGIVTNEDGRGNRVVLCTAPDHGAMFSR
jgi:hypothetical protein